MPSCNRAVTKVVFLLSFTGQSFLFNGSSLYEMNYLASLKKHSKIQFGCQNSKGVVKTSTIYNPHINSMLISLKVMPWFRNGLYVYTYNQKLWPVILYLSKNLNMAFKHTNIPGLLFLPHLTLNLPWNIIIGQQTSHNVIWRYGANNL